jgi:hypothetical protein
MGSADNEMKITTAQICKAGALPLRSGVLTVINRSIGQSALQAAAELKR